MKSHIKQESYCDFYATSVECKKRRIQQAERQYQNKYATIECLSMKSVFVWHLSSVKRWVIWSRQFLHLIKPWTFDNGEFTKMTIGSEFNSHYLLIRCLLVVVLIEYSNGGNGKYWGGVGRFSRGLRKKWFFCTDFWAELNKKTRKI